MKPISRRDFFRAAAVTGAALPVIPDALGAERGTLPTRVLGGTGQKVSILAFGCGSRFLMYEDEETALAVLNKALDAGITYLDTAYAYGNGKSEERVGKVMKTRRKEVFLATKLPDRDRDGALRRFEGSLKRLQTDHVDLLHIHSLQKEDDLKKIEAPDGVLKALYEIREQKMARFIGMTSHTDGAVMKMAIEHNDLNCVQMAMNAARALGFEELALPAAKAKNLGVIAMKVTAQEKLVGSGEGRAGIEALLRYSLSLPVAAAVVGMPKVEMLEENITVARAFRPLSEEEKDKVHKQVEGTRVAVEHFFREHWDC